MIPENLYSLPTLAAALEARGEEPAPAYQCRGCPRELEAGGFVSTAGLGADLPAWLCHTCASGPHRAAVAAQEETARAAAAAVGDFDWTDVRGERDVRLTRCDWTQMPDADLTEAQREAWRLYRQALRDVTASGSPDAVVWPSAPSWDTVPSTSEKESS